MEIIRRSSDATGLEAEFRINIARVTSVIEASDSVEELLDYCPDDFLSGKISFANRIHADDQNIVIDAEDYVSHKAVKVSLPG